MPFGRRQSRPIPSSYCCRLHPSSGHFNPTSTDFHCQWQSQCKNQPLTTAVNIRWGSLTVCLPPGPAFHAFATRLRFGSQRVHGQRQNLSVQTNVYQDRPTQRRAILMADRVDTFRRASSACRVECVWHISVHSDLFWLTPSAYRVP